MPSKNKQISYSVSLLFHILVVILLLFINLSFDYSPSEYVELSFGVSTEMGSSGAQGNKIEKIDEVAKPEVKSQTEFKSKEVKEVELPLAKNTEDENVVVPADKE